MIIDCLNQKHGITNMFKHVWDGTPCLVCFKNANFMWVEIGEPIVIYGNGDIKWID